MNGDDFKVGQIGTVSHLTYKVTSVDPESKTGTVKVVGVKYTDDFSDAYVVVTIADNGVVHAWGDDESQPYKTRSAAQTRIRGLKKTDAELYPSAKVTYKTCKILGRIPQPTEMGKL